MTSKQGGGSVLIMARSRELWLWAGASCVAAGAAFGGVAGGLAAARPGYQLWSSGPMVGVYAACVFAFACSSAAVRDWTFPGDRSGGAPGTLAWGIPPTAGWVKRAELGVVVSALTDASAGAVTLATGLAGAGGFGKTMLAAQACRERAVQRRFPGGVCWITVGQGLDGERLAQRISEKLRGLGVEGAAFTSVEEAGQALAMALAARRRRCWWLMTCGPAVSWLLL